MATKKAATEKKTKKPTTRTKKAVTKTSAPEVKVAPVETYVYAVGRRKTAVAQVRYFPTVKSEGLSVTVNGRPYETYFKTFEQREAVVAPLKKIGREQASVSVHVMGGGLSGQADAVKLGIARALVAHDPLLRAALKVEKFLTRDPRAVERKKPGLHKARRAPQWAKR